MKQEMKSELSIGDMFAEMIKGDAKISVGKVGAAAAAYTVEKPQWFATINVTPPGMCEMTMSAIKSTAYEAIEATYNSWLKLKK